MKLGAAAAVTGASNELRGGGVGVGRRGAASAHGRERWRRREHRGVGRRGHRGVGRSGDGRHEAGGRRGEDGVRRRVGLEQRLSVVAGRSCGNGRWRIGVGRGLPVARHGPS